MLQVVLFFVILNAENSYIYVMPKNPTPLNILVLYIAVIALAVIAVVEAFVIGRLIGLSF